jgi:transposase
LKSKGISNVEIARKFGVSEGAIRKWLKKAETE